MTATDPVKGPWTPAKKLPAALYSLPANDNWADVRMNVPGKSAKEAPVVFVTTEPAEMILTKGEPSYSPIPGTRLMRVANTDSTLFLHAGEGQYYLLVAGHWFRTRTLDGPWAAASTDLPADFVNIPDNNPAAYVKASVPGTREAKDAVLMASVPTSTTVVITNVTVQATYSGPPQFVVIQGTTVQYAVNSPNTVFLVSGGYYWCNQGAWLCSPTANGPWTFCTSVPSAIYTIPPTHPTYNVTYVVVQSSTPTTVVYSQTSGYSGEYMAATGVLMFGMGMLVGAAIANNNDCYYCYPPPCHYSYGCGAVYHHGYGGYYSSAHAYGPYGGAGRAAAYNPYTGTYSRGAYAYGPNGSAGVKQAYNPYTGGYAQSARVNTAYGSAGRFYADNGNGEQAWGGYRSTSQGTVAGVRTSEGTGAAAWDTRNGQGAVAKDKEGNVYAAKDGNVYKKDSSGSWSQNSGNGWESATPPSQQSRSTSSQSSQTRSTQPSTTQTRTGTTAQPSQTSRTTTPTTSSARTTSASSKRMSADTQQQLNRDSQSRSWGGQQASKTSSYQRSRSSSGKRSSGSWKR